MIRDLLRHHVTKYHHALTLLGLVGVAAFLTGCGSKPHPDLYEPGDIPAWRTIESDESLRRSIPEGGPRVVLETSEGPITVELFAEQAPLSTANFLQYVQDGFYDGTVFHRVIPGFMIQGGGFTADLQQKETREPITNEAANGLRNTRGTLAMARTDAIDSATAQFFINLVDNGFLNGDGEVDGYAVFGRVIEGMNVVDQIALVQTTSEGGMNNVPVDPVVISSATLIQE